MKKRICVISFLLILIANFYYSTITSTALSYSGESMYAYLQLLNSEQLSVYNQIYQNIIDFNEELFVLNTPISEDSLEDTMNSLFNDHPELFWVYTSYQYAVDSSNIVHKVKLKYCISKEELPQAQAAFDSVLNSLVSGARQYTNQLDQEKYLHDEICKMNTYDSNNHMNQSAYSALTTGSSVCAGYARAFQAACQRLGITCYYVTGVSMGSTHAWNIVKIDGKFYNVDLTWDDSISESIGFVSYDYFNKSDAAFSSDHSRSALSGKLVACN